MALIYGAKDTEHVTGVLFVIMLFDTEQWRRLVPRSPLILLQAWNTWVHYATFQLPPELNGFYGYNALQQIAYFCVVFVFSPLAILTSIAMSPAVVNRFLRYAGKRIVAPFALP